MQFIDVRDIVDWIIHAAEQNLTGTFNITGRPGKLTTASMLETIRNVTRSDARFTWVDEKFIFENDVQPWNELPLYLPESDEESKGFMFANIENALDNGLKIRPLAGTVNDTYEWRRDESVEMRAGISRVREGELLKKWHELHG